jgi:thymidylate synthase (FAD)
MNGGFIRIINAAYSQNLDEEVASAARDFHACGTTITSSHRGLIRHLMQHKHAAPFEMVEFKFHIKMPTYEAYQYFGHRAATIVTNTCLMKDGSLIYQVASEDRQSKYTEFYWVVNLNTLLNHLENHLDSTYTYKIFNLIKELVPITLEAFIDFRIARTQEPDFIGKFKFLKL